MFKVGDKLMYNATRAAEYYYTRYKIYSINKVNFEDGEYYYYLSDNTSEHKKHPWGEGHYLSEFVNVTSCKLIQYINS